MFLSYAGSYGVLIRNYKFCMFARQFESRWYSISSMQINICHVLNHCSLIDLLNTSLYLRTTGAQLSFVQLYREAQKHCRNTYLYLYCLWYRYYWCYFLHFTFILHCNMFLPQIRVYLVIIYKWANHVTALNYNVVILDIRLFNFI